MLVRKATLCSEVFSCLGGRTGCSSWIWLLINSFPSLGSSWDGCPLWNLKVPYGGGHPRVNPGDLRGSPKFVCFALGWLGWVGWVALGSFGMGGVASSRATWVGLGFCAKLDLIYPIYAFFACFFIFFVHNLPHICDFASFFTFLSPIFACYDGVWGKSVKNTYFPLYMRFLVVFCIFLCLFCAHFSPYMRFS